MDMIIFAVCMPVVVVILLGIIYGGKPAFDGADYTFLEQSASARYHRSVQAVSWGCLW